MLDQSFNRGKLLCCSKKLNQSQNRPLIYSEFIVSNQSVEYLTQVFLHSYERAGISHLDRRLAAAKYYDQKFR